MATTTSSVSKHFPKPQDGFTTTTSGSVSSGATSVGLNSTGSYANGDVVVLIVDPTDAAKKQAFTGTVDTGGSQITGVVWTSGTNQNHSAGATVVDYASATHIGMISKGLLAAHGQDGTHKSAASYPLAVIADLTNMTHTHATTAQGGTLTHTAFPAGAIVQVVSVASSALATGTTVTPFDDTIPTITEGDEYLTLAITPKSATNILVIEAVAALASSVSNHLIVALHQDAVSAGLAATATYQATSAAITSVPLNHSMAAGTTSSTTFRIRCGQESPGTLTFNGRSGARFFGAITKSSIVITEYKV